MVLPIDLLGTLRKIAPHELAPFIWPALDGLFRWLAVCRRFELEKDLSIKKQLLDVVILRKQQGRFAGQLPDGFDDLAIHNLLTFKSYWEALDDWALKELTGHYVNYRKQVSPSLKSLLPEEEFRLYAVCSRYPNNLAGVVDLKTVQTG